MKVNNYLTHGIHPYHAKFIPAIPNEYIRKYTKENDWVLDPFCGSGTSLLEALLLNRNCVGIDMSPIAYKISKAKCAKISGNQLLKYLEYIKDSYNNITVYDKVDFNNKYIWYTEETANVFDKLLYIFSKIDDLEIRNIFEVILSSISKTCSNKRKTWNNGYIADNVLPNIKYEGDAFEVFIKKVNNIAKNYDELYELLKNNNSKINIFNENILNYDSDIKFNLVVTSPPYPFAVDFIKYHRLSLYWFGYDVIDYAEKETGSRHKRGRKNASNEFFKEMEILYKHIFDLVAIGGYFCMTVGDTEKKKEKIDFVAWLYGLFENNGWELVSDDIREIECQSMGQKRIPKEHKLVFRKVK